ncbi:response regulator transcription factor [Rhodoferax sp.]|uniref:response regulator transcription factor n=1 Tax=Rhodoferax sp. TaxID=50421 RepID=UPI0027315867|nr:response regulator transcription factor [Rhodoferax sp.]MDP1531464.1 response regulator transcription factor [Rhodoferax sp.]MDP1944128.1 response regulator transcription factor [Rhodoferax sp.]MDP2442038.1 response regulator transcription factor [Rhodoferax sp.]MDZ4206478.1 response regulator transcription factor [Rhodoferax sp.]
MSTQHFFLSSPASTLPERLREAFADIAPLSAEALLARLPALPAAQSLIWLSATDAQWPQALRQILQAKPDAHVVLLSGVPEPAEGLRALNDGARGYTHAYGVPALLQEVALVIEHGGLWVGPDLLQRLVGSTNAALAAQQAVSKAQSPAVATAGAAPNAWALLSAREVQVARAVSAGRSNKEVADKMFISERTVKAHLGAIFEKLGVRDRLQLVLRLAASPEPASTSAAEPRS